MKPTSLKSVILVIIGVCSIVPFSWGQTISVGISRYWIQFKDKKNSPYSITTPSAFLSARSIQRRLNQSVPIEYTDLPVNQSYVDSVAATGAHIHIRSKWFNGVVVKVTGQAQLTAITNLSFVVGSVPVGGIKQAPGAGSSEKFRTIPVADAHKPISSDPTTASLNYGPSLNQISMLDGVCMHDKGYQGQGMVIAILDAGFQHADTLKAFDSLRVNNQILGTHDFVDENDSVYGADRHFHGTCVLSCMGGNMPGSLIGTAPKAKYWLFITEDVNSEYVVEEYNWAAGAERADSAGADVINTSLGYTTFDDSILNHNYASMNGHTTPCARAANYASNKGIAVVCAAGNMGGTAWHYIGTPADADSVLAVGSVNSSGVYSSFSSEGPGSGGDVKPAVASEGEGSIVADWASNGILAENGTSFASPIMCGMVACLWQAHPTLTNTQILHAIEASATQFAHPDSMLGYGIPDFCLANSSLGIHEGSLADRDYLSNIFPNPFTGSVQIIFWSSQSQDVCVTLSDLCGRVICTEKYRAAVQSYNNWALSGLSPIPAGLYLITVKTGNEVFVKKLMKE